MSSYPEGSQAGSVWKTRWRWKGRFGVWALKNLHLPPCLVKTLLPCLSGISLGQALRGVTVRGARQGQINSMNFDQNITTVRMCHKLCVFGAEFPPVLTLNSTTWEFILSSYFFLNINIGIIFSEKGPIIIFSWKKSLGLKDKSGVKWIWDMFNMITCWDDRLGAKRRV